MTLICVFNKYSKIFANTQMAALKMANYLSRRNFRRI